eukprot:3234395-Pyramimonas_sp.AAC.1
MPKRGSPRARAQQTDCCAGFEGSRRLAVYAACHVKHGLMAAPASRPATAANHACYAQRPVLGAF